MKTGWCMSGYHSTCPGVIIHTTGRIPKTECACDGKGHTTPHLKAPAESDEATVRRK
jgi:hypothetical protein